MGINLGDFGSKMNNQQAQPAGGAMPILNLKKNDILDLTKRNPGLKNVILGAGWDVAENGQSFDLDIAAFMLDANNKFNSVENVIFFNNKNGQGVSLSGDNRTGSIDSRSFGCIPLEKIESTVAIRIWPLEKWGKVK